MDLQSVLQTIFGKPAHLPLIPSGDEQILLSDDFPKFSTESHGQIIEPVPMHLVKIKLLLHREKVALRDLLKKIGDAHKASQQTKSELIQSTVPKQGLSTGEVNVDFFARIDQRLAPPGASEEDRRAIADITYNVSVLTDLFEMLNKNYQVRNIRKKIPLDCISRIVYDPGTKALVYVSMPRARAKAEGTYSSLNIPITGARV